MKKICSRCGQEKELKEFNKRKMSNDGYNSACKECRKIETKKYRKEKIKQIKETKKNCYEKNKEHYLKHGKENYYKNQKEKIRQSHDYYHSHKEQYKKRIKERRLNGEFYFRDIDKRHKRRAQQKETDITKEWLIQLKEESIACPLCGKKMLEIKEPFHPDQKQLDHIIPLFADGKHMKNNVRYICGECNNKRPKK